ncbi:uncharacterized protein LOC111273875 [Varroa jacobsoni]|uniref:uncharacterized protein LOC111273875 n=1 Tax=Varroa jacobsoni TaxID=62625 RepID=UPI000BF97D12|nr:uncharacterized protein LOC111273875 [Varroa jacobsoni]
MQVDGRLFVESRRAWQDATISERCMHQFTPESVRRHHRCCLFFCSTQIALLNSFWRGHKQPHAPLDDDGGIQFGKVGWARDKARRTNAGKNVEKESEQRNQADEGKREPGQSALEKQDTTRAKEQTLSTDRYEGPMKDNTSVYNSTVLSGEITGPNKER